MTTVSQIIKLIFDEVTQNYSFFQIALALGITVGVAVGIFEQGVDDYEAPPKRKVKKVVEKKGGRWSENDKWD